VAGVATADMPRRLPAAPNGPLSPGPTAKSMASTVVAIRPVHQADAAAAEARRRAGSVTASAKYGRHAGVDGVAPLGEDVAGCQRRTRAPLATIKPKFSGMVRPSEAVPPPPPQAARPSDAASKRRGDGRVDGAGLRP